MDPHCELAKVLSVPLMEMSEARSMQGCCGE